MHHHWCQVYHMRKHYNVNKIDIYWSVPQSCAFPVPTVTLVVNRAGWWMSPCCSCVFHLLCWPMMTSLNGNIFRVTDPLCGEFTGPGDFPTQRPVTRSFDVFFDLRLNKRLSKQPWGWWYETPSLWRQCNECFFLQVCIWGKQSDSHTANTIKSQIISVHL